MAEIVNLRRARKARDRADKAAQADANRALHGRSKAEKLKSTLEHEQLSRTVDGAKIDTPDTED